MNALLLMLSIATWGATPAHTPDPAAGRERSVACQACHGPNGVSVDAEVPNLAGQKAPYLVAQLTAFKAGERKHDVMNALAGQLQADEIDNLAAFWSSLPAVDAHAGAAPSPLRRSTLNFPADFPKDYVVYAQSEDPAAGTVSRSYASPTAVAAVRAGKAMPVGSTIVVATARMKRGEDKAPIKGDDGHYQTEPESFFSVMASVEGQGRDTPELLRNGDWGYGLFDAKHARVETVNYAMCLGCHKARANDSYVFTIDALRAHLGVKASAKPAT